MFEVEKVGEDRLNISVRGKLDADQMNKLLDEALEKSEGIERGKMLLDLAEYKFPSIAAMVAELLRLPSTFRCMKRFDKEAIIIDDSAFGMVLEIEGLFMPGIKIRAFHKTKAEDAEAWLRGGKNQGIGEGIL